MEALMSRVQHLQPFVEARAAELQQFAALAQQARRVRACGWACAAAGGRGTQCIASAPTRTPFSPVRLLPHSLLHSLFEYPLPATAATCRR